MKKFKWIQSEYILIAITFILVIILCIIYYGIKQKKYDIHELLYVTKSLKLDEQERDSQYKQMMVRILTVQSYRYDKRHRCAMNKNEKIDYINKNLRYAKAIKVGYYDVPIIHQMETSFDPYAEGDYGEYGLGQMKWLTALFCYASLKSMPANLRYLLSFDLKSPKDLYNPITALKTTYIYLWWLRRDYKGREDWYVSGYHWGGFIRKRWDKGKGEVPNIFTLNGIKYKVYKYYMSFGEWKTAYERGKLEPSKPIKKLWRAYVKKLRREEIDFRRTKSIIRGLRKELKKEIDMRKDYEDHRKEVDRKLKRADKELKKIGKKANKRGWLKGLYEDVKDVIKNFLSKDKKKKKKKK